LCAFFLGQYDKVLHDPSPDSAEPLLRGAYVSRGLAYTAEKKYPEAQQSFLAVLQIFPNNQAAVENLARAYYLVATGSGQWRCWMKRRSFLSLLPFDRGLRR